ncbi:UDP-N-acetylglucosamine 1-carboxyvinyltransferase [Mycobacterium xenopi 4042]|uniref:UDP-N-acetylglucosamine 1-carboxyvinyltransferase n=1 Tax=Mycobacterium xenopi 4042 TaxID=1299334 RepID=X8DYQ7_MYCXE|nr:UDP-N-acetylglucosamine 1-carboxyvinyltransferase [Mycobacterium xenopi 4042]
MVTGGNRLSGEVAVGGAKNSVLKLMAAALLAEGTSTITNCPDILDVPLMAEVLRGLGATVELSGSTVRITSPDELKYDADFAAVRQFRASVCVLGPLVGRCKRAKVALPGGDAIGSRPLDMHQAGLRQLGADCNIEHGCVVAQAETLRGAEIQLEFPSVGATENILMAAVLAEGVTTIHNAAREPDVVDLCTMLNQMGAQVEGAGSPTMKITGVPRLYPTEHRVIGDRIVAATWGIAAAMTRGDITVTGVDPLICRWCCTSCMTPAPPSRRPTTASGLCSTSVRRLSMSRRCRSRVSDRSAADGDRAGLDRRRDVDDHRERVRSAVPLRRGDDPTRCRRPHGRAPCRGAGSAATLQCAGVVFGHPCRAGLVLAGLVADGDTEVHDVFHIDRAIRCSWKTLLVSAPRSNA